MRSLPAVAGLVAALAAACAPPSDCPPGTAGCSCLAEGGGCRLPSLACVEGTCAVGDPRCEDGACIPAAPRCFSPCDGDLVAADGAVRSCSAEGLLDGCVGGRACDRGSCVLPALLEQGLLVHSCEGDRCTQRWGLSGETLTERECRDDPRCCLDAAGCPDHQVCIRGGCFSDCDADDDCSKEGDRCLKQACRAECAGGDAGPCPAGQVCAGTGYCQPAVAAQAPLELREGDFSVRPAGEEPAGGEEDGGVSLAFRPGRTSGRFEIHNAGSHTEVFEVRKAAEWVVTDDGGVQARLAVDGEDPLAWVALGRAGSTERVESVRVYVPPSGSVTVEVAGARREDLPRWRGMVEVVHDQWGVERIDLVYNEGLAGRWAGEAHYFAAFEDGAASCGDPGGCPVERWLADKADTSALAATSNAFLQAWARFRRGAFSLVDLGYVARAVLSGSWSSALVDALCGEAGFGDSAACAIAPGPGGRLVVPISSDVTRDRIPSGGLALPLALVVEAEPEPGAVRSCLSESGEAPPACLRGRIDSSGSLQYPGDPELTLRVEASPAEVCGAEQERACLIGLGSGLLADLSAGGRYVPLPGEACGPGFEQRATPWLPPGLSPPGGGEESAECRDLEVPLGPAADRRSVRNASLAGANPLPDGRVLARRVELVDGVVVEQDVMLLLLRERIGAGGWTWAYAVLQRQDALPGEARGEAPGTPSGERPAEDAGGGCSRELLQAVLGVDPAGLAELPAAWAEELARVVVLGDPAADLAPLDVAVSSAFSYRTELQGLTGGQVGFVPEICRGEESLLPYCYDPSEIEAVRGRIDCAAALYDARFLEGPLETATWAATRATLRSYLERSASVRLLDNAFGDPISAPGFERLYAELLLLLGDESLESALAARFDLAGTQLRSFEGSRFEPGGVDLTGAAGHELSELYEAIQYYEQALDRLQGHVPRWRRTFAAGGAYVTPSTLTDYVALTVTASTRLAQGWTEVARRYEALDRPDLARRVVERAYARAYLESRLLSRLQQDLAARLPVASQAQAELVRETALRRYRVAMLGLRSYYEGIVDGPSAFGFSPDYVPFPLLDELDSSALDEMLRIAREHAEAAAGDEDRALERSRSFAVEEAEFQQELVEIRQAHQAELGRLCGTFRAADGRVYPALARYRHLVTEESGADVNALAAGLVDPCGGLGVGEIAARYLDLERAQLGLQRVAHEQEALAERIRLSGDRVTELCEALYGTPGADGSLPADPAGGSWTAAGEARQEAVDVLHEANEWIGYGLGLGDRLIKLILGGKKNTFGFLKRVDKYVGAKEDLKKAKEKAEKKAKETHRRAQLQPDDLDVLREALEEAGEMGTTIDVPLSIYTAAATAGVVSIFPEPLVAPAHAISVGVQVLNGIIAAVLRAVSLVARAAGGAVQNVNRAAVRELLRDKAVAERRLECEYEQLDTRYAVAELRLDSALLAMDAVDALRSVAVILADLAALGDERRRLEAQWEDTEQLAVHVAAARDDPTRRVLRTDAVINADASFRRAVRSAYRATRVFEYTASRSYPALDELFLGRMVRAGDHSLLRYLDDLEDATWELQEEYGRPDTRVLVLSLRDDLLAVPRYDDGPGGSLRALSQAERVERLRALLQASRRSDARGRISVPFATELEELSPRTWGHEVLSVEAEVVGRGLPEAVARLYLVQDGASVVRTADGDRLPYGLPPVTAVIDAGAGVAGPAAPGTSLPAPLLHGRGTAADAPLGRYRRSFRLRGRPLVSSGWRLLIDLRDEPGNAGLRLGMIDDVVLRIFYTDFTAD